MSNQEGAIEVFNIVNEMNTNASPIETIIDNEIEILEVPVEEMVLIKQEHLEIMSGFDDNRIKNIIVSRLNIFRERLKDSTEDFLSILIGSDLQIISQAIFDGRKLYDKDMSFDNGFVDITGILDSYIKLLDEHGKNPPVKLCNPETQQAELIGNIDTKVPFLAKELIESVKVQAETKK